MPDDNKDKNTEGTRLKELEAKLAELESDKQRILAKNEELLSEKKTIKTKYDATAEEIEELRQFKQKQEQQQLLKKGDYDKALAQIKADYEKKLEEYKNQFSGNETELKQKLEKLQAEVETLKLDNKAIEVFSSAGAIAPEQLFQLVRKDLELDEKGNVVSKDGYKTLTLDEYAKKIKEDDKFKHHFKANVSTSTYTRTTSPSGTSGVENPFLKDSYNLTKQAELYKNNRPLYEQLKAAASS